jgi:hypothetical protein
MIKQKALCFPVMRRNRRTLVQKMNDLTSSNDAASWSGVKGSEYLEGYG